MSEQVTRSIKFNAVMNTLLTASNTLVGIVTLPYVTRALSVEGYGNVNFVQSISTWLVPICTVGITAYGVRECARVRDNAMQLARVVRELLIIITIFTALTLGVFALCILLIPRFVELSPLLWMFLISTLLSSYGVEWYYQAVEQYEYITIRSVLFKVLSLVTILALIHSEDDWLLYGAIVALVPCCNNIFNIVRLFKDINLFGGETVSLRRHAKPLVSYAASTISSSFYLSFDSILLGMLNSNNVQVALYQLAVKLKNICWQVINSVIGVLIPRLSYYAKNAPEKYDNLLKRGNGFLLNVCLGVMLYLFIYAMPLVTLVSSGKYANAALPIQIIGVANFVSCMSYFYGQCILSPLSRERSLATANTIGLAISLLLNAVLDRPFGAVGASIAATISEGSIFIALGLRSRDILQRITTLSGVLRTLIPHITAFAVAIIPMQLLHHTGIDITTTINAGIAVVAGFIVYSIVWLVAAVIVREETSLWVLETIRAMLHKTLHRIVNSSN
ncbi:flippase [Bifidobacterium mongoliense]|uniref:flippase n=1 Tax=Bifidobacterium mongoliense TaxID=518643 RepID=UPI0030EBE40A